MGRTEEHGLSESFLPERIIWWFSSFLYANSYSLLVVCVDGQCWFRWILHYGPSIVCLLFHPGSLSELWGLESRTQMPTPWPAPSVGDSTTLAVILVRVLRELQGRFVSWQRSQLLVIKEKVLESEDMDSNLSSVTLYDREQVTFWASFSLPIKWRSGRGKWTGWTPVLSTFKSIILWTKPTQVCRTQTLGCCSPTRVGLVPVWAMGEWGRERTV